MARRALVVGWNGPKEYGQLRYAESDPDKMKELLESPRLGFEVNKSNEQEKRTFDDAVCGFLDSLSTDDTIIIYVSCHGVIRDKLLYLVTNDFDPARIISTGYEANTLVQNIHKARAKHKLLILDCCHASAFSFPGEKSLETEFETILKGRSFQILAASKKLEFAREFDFSKSSFLCYALTKSIENLPTQGQGASAIIPALGRLAANVHAPNLGPIPSPHIVGKSDPDFPLILPQKSEAQESGAQHVNESRKSTNDSSSLLPQTFLITATIITLIGVFLYRPPSSKIETRDSNILPVGNSAQLGASSAPITIVLFVDHLSPEYNNIVHDVLKYASSRKGQVRIVFKHFPNKFNRSSVLASQASIAAHKQGKFWEMHEVLSSQKDALASIDTNSQDAIYSLAKQIHLNMDKFSRDFDSNATKEALTSDRKLALSVGLRDYFWQNQFFINGTRVVPTSQASTSLRAQIENVIDKQDNLTGKNKRLSYDKLVSMNFSRDNYTSYNYIEMLMSSCIQIQSDLTVKAFISPEATFSNIQISYDDDVDMEDYYETYYCVKDKLGEVSSTYDARQLAPTKEPRLLTLLLRNHLQLSR